MFQVLLFIVYTSTQKSDIRIISPKFILVITHELSDLPKIKQRKSNRRRKKNRYSQWIA